MRETKKKRKKKPPLFQRKRGKIESKLASRYKISKTKMDADKAQRRERIATAILAGIHANAAFADIDCRMAAKCAIDGAEALIAELDRNK